MVVKTTAVTHPSSVTADRVAAAAVTVVARDGFDMLSVRTVAREAGLSGGAVQYHYATRAELLLAAYGRTVQSILGRLAGTDLAGPLPLALGRLCREALPLDPQRQRECAVWAALSAAAAAHPQLSVEHAKALKALTDVIAGAVNAALAVGELDSTVNADVAAGVLIAVLDGLTLHGISGSRAPAELTATLDAAIALVLHQP